MDKIAIFIVYDRAVDEEVLDTLAGCGIEKFTRWHDVSGVGENGPHLGDHIWPAMNNVMMTVAESEKRDEVLKRIRALQGKFPYVGLRAIVVPVLEMI